jgi:hypothetical protein
VIVKILTICIMLLVSALSLVPCCAPGAEVSNDLSVSASSDCCNSSKCEKDSDQKQEHESEDNGCGSCSPFFACGSCPGFTFQAIDLSLSHIDLTASVSYSSYEVRVYSEYFNKKWQPPKIA